MFIVPTRLENLFGRCEYLAQFCVFGHGHDQPSLLATLSERGQSLSPEALEAELAKLLEQINSEVPGYEKVGGITITPEWTIENGLLTPTMKLKRNRIVETYAQQATIDGIARLAK